MSISDTVIQLAKECGFDLVGITTNNNFEESREFAIQHINQGNMIGLNWYTPQRVLRGTQPSELMPEVQSIISVGLNYYQPHNANDVTDAHIARYAQGRDYHKTIKSMIKTYIARLEELINCGIMAKWYVDDGPMMDKSVAFRSGLGWFGKNSNILTKTHGSWILLGEILTDLELVPSQPLQTSCGECTICIDMCPTGAISAPYVITNSKCISFHTIENRGTVPPELRKSFGNWVFGCDICQDVCPVNRFSKEHTSREFDTSRTQTTIKHLLEMSEDEFKKQYAGTPVMRAKYQGMKRNACIVAGNQINQDHLPGLTNCLSSSDPIVRGHAAWALGQFGTAKTTKIIKDAFNKEEDPKVIQEIKLVLKEIK
tara:strand:+ start:44342 stop:45454 length:1113 start_codon:yes stop_codon:yes gene_type:complete